MTETNGLLLAILIALWGLGSGEEKHSGSGWTPKGDHWGPGWTYKPPRRRWYDREFRGVRLGLWAGRIYLCAMFLIPAGLLIYALFQ
jgi:hypothetical protein